MGDAFDLRPYGLGLRTRRVGGLRFVWIGRLVISWSVSRPLGMDHLRKVCVR